MRVPRWGLFAVAATAVAAHGRSLLCGFVFDDRSAILANPVVRGGFDVGRLLRADFWGLAPGQGVGTWRPLPVLSFWLNQHLGNAPWCFHLTNVLLHAAAAVTLVLAAARATGRPRAALAAGLLFAALAVNSEAVDSLVGRADIMAAGFALAAWWIPGPAAAAPLFAALLCKESALVVPVWLLLADLAVRRRPSARRYLALAAAAAAYLALRTVLFAAPWAPGTIPIKLINNSLVDAALGPRLLTGFRLCALALRKILAPITLSSDYGYAQILPEHGLSFDVALGAVALAGAAAGAVALRRRAPAIAAGLVILLVGLAPVSNVPVLLPTIFAERLLYLPAAGAALALAAALARLRTPLAVALLVALAGANLARSVVRAGDWQDEDALFAAAARSSPRCSRALTNHGVALLARGRLAQAEAAFEGAISIAPFWALPHSYAGLVLARQGRLGPAEAELRTACLLDPELAEATVNLATFLAENGRAAEAAAILRPFVARRPEVDTARRLLERLQR